MKLSAKAQARLDQVLERFQEGDLSPFIEAARITLPEDAPAAKWSYNNRVLAVAQSGTPDCRGFKQWQDVGRQVKYGSKASFIFKAWTEEDEHGKERFKTWITLPVHPYNNTKEMNDYQGEPLDYTPKEPPPLLDIAHKLGIHVTFMPTGDDKLGWCKSDGSQIAVGNEDWRTFFHELGHAADAKVHGKLEGGQHEDQETTAELTACVLMDLYGHDRTGNAWSYISAYNPKDPMSAIQKACKAVGRILDYLFEEAA